MSVLIVERTPGLHRVLQAQLQQHGLTATSADSAAAALDHLRRESYTVILIDQQLADGSAIDVLDTLRRSGSSAHVIILSSPLDGDEARSAALRRSADDFFTPPFTVPELIARVLTVHRWIEPRSDAVLQVGRITLDLNARQAYKDESSLELTSKEFDLLAFLATRPGHAFSRDQLLRTVWHSGSEWQQIATVTEHVRRIRVKIEEEPRQPVILQTVRGTGYRLVPPATPNGPSAPTVADADRIDTLEQRSGTLVHVDGEVVAADAATLALFGTTDTADVIGRQIHELVSAAFKDSMRVRTALSRSERRSQLIEIERIDGTTVAVEVSSSEVDWAGQPAGLLTITRVAHESARLRRMVTGVLSDVTDAVIVVDMRYHLRSWNAAAERLYGWTEAEVLGRHVLDILRWVGDEGALARILDGLAVKGQWKGESRQRAHDGSVIDVLATTSLLRDEAGEPVLIVSVNRPLTPSITRERTTPGIDDVEIRRGLEGDEFEIYYQPVVSLDDLHVVTMEALLRWHHPERGLLPPSAIIAAAERSGAIVELGKLVLEKACLQGAQWRRDGHDIELSVNLSARQLSNPDLCDHVAEVLASTGMEPSKLWLEVTETALVEEVDRASEMLHRLADIGIGIAIDDFGTGWASLTYLRRFPIHALKIDRSFVAGVDTNDNDSAIARSVLTLGAELGLSVVAEGIETIAQQRALQALGCTLGQGYLFGRPVPASAAPLHRARIMEPELADARETPRALLTGSARAPLTRTTSAVPSGAERRETDATALLLRQLLRVTSVDGAVTLLQDSVIGMGGRLVLASEAGDDALTPDVSLGEGAATLVTVGHATASREQLVRLLPAMVADATEAVNLLRQHE